MQNKDVREKVKQKLKEIGHKPSVRGGNGHGPTNPEKLIMEAIPEITWNYAIGLGSRGNGYPSNYKVDLAFPDLKLAIEVNGNSHNVLSRREQDLKKVARLTTLGWTVLRFKNQEVIQQTQKVISTILESKGILASQLTKS